MRGHLSPAGCRIARRADRLQKHLLRGYAEHQRQRTIAVIRIKPVMSRAEHQPGRCLDGFVPRGTDLEKDAALTLKQNLAVIQPPRHVHRPKRPDEIVA